MWSLLWRVRRKSSLAPSYTGEGYSLYLPDEDWPAPTHSEDGGVPTEQWVSIYNDDVWLKVSYYQGMTAPEAREEFARSSGAEFEDLMGGEPGDPLTAIYPEKHFLSFISVEDYAYAMIDELEQENHHYERFTAAY